MVPAEGIVHVGRADYMLVSHGSDAWQVTEVQVGELHDSGMEVLGGLHAGDQIAGQGAILLKPFIIQALQGPIESPSQQVRKSPGSREGRPT